jgi:hypothetical protein
MKSMFSGTGAAFVGCWRALPAPAKVVIVTGILLLSGAELVVELNHALNAPDLARGQAGIAVGESGIKNAESAAANASIEDIRSRIATGRTVSTKEALALKEYEIREAEERRTRAEAGLKELELFVNTTMIKIIGDVVNKAQEK